MILQIQSFCVGTVRYVNFLYRGYIVRTILFYRFSTLLSNVTYGVYCTDYTKQHRRAQNIENDNFNNIILERNFDA